MCVLRKSKAAAGWAAFAFLVLAVLVPWHRHQRDIKTPMSVAFDNLRFRSMQLLETKGLFAQKLARDHEINHPSTGGLHFGPMRNVELHDQCGPCRVVVEPRMGRGVFHDLMGKFHQAGVMTEQKHLRLWLKVKKRNWLSLLTN